MIRTRLIRGQRRPISWGVPIVGILSAISIHNYYATRLNQIRNLDRGTYRAPACRLTTTGGVGIATMGPLRKNSARRGRASAPAVDIICSTTSDLRLLEVR